MQPQQIIQKIESDYGVSLSGPTTRMNSEAKKVAILCLRRMKVPLKEISPLLGNMSLTAIHVMHKSAEKNKDIVFYASQYLPRQSGLYKVRLHNRDTVAEFTGKDWKIIGSEESLTEWDFDRIIGTANQLLPQKV